MITEGRPTSGHAPCTADYEAGEEFRKASSDGIVIGIGDELNQMIQTIKLHLVKFRVLPPPLKRMAISTSLIALVMLTVFLETLVQIFVRTQHLLMDDT